MSSGPDTQTVTQRTEPSPMLTQGISNVANASNQAFLGANPLQNMGQLALANRGLEGSPVVGDARNLTRQTLQGDFLSPDSNPYLQSTFDRAADLTQTRLASEFSGAGRDLGASRPARSEELQTLASNIFGQNFARERGLQANAVNQSIPLANQDFTDINALIDAGNLPIDQFINRIGALAPAAGGTAVSSQPIHRNTAGGVLGGAAAGASIGSAVPVIGTGLGALGGGLLGLFG